MDFDYDVIIIGAGFAGAATAYHLSQSKKFRILILEKESEPGAHASGKNAGLLRQAVNDLAVAAMVQETLHALEHPPADWERKNIFRPCGSILLGENSSLSGFADLLKNLRTPHEVRGRNVFPENLDQGFRRSLAAADYEAMLVVPRDGVVDISSLLLNYLEAARAHGTTLNCGTEVLGVAPEKNGWNLETSGDRFRGRSLINAAGAWAGELGLAAGLPDPGLDSFRRHLYLGSDPAWLGGDFPYLWDTKHEWYFRADPQGLLLCGGDAEPHPAKAPQLEPGQETALRDKLRAYFPALAGVEIQRGWACLRTFWRGGPLRIEEEPAAPGYFWVAGLGGHGMGSSFGLGRRAAERITAFLNRQNP